MRSAACAAVSSISSPTLMPGRRGSGRRTRPRAARARMRGPPPREAMAPGSSRRNALTTSMTCAVGGTPSRSSSRIFSMWSSTCDSSLAIRSTSASVSSRRARRATCNTCSRSSIRSDSSVASQKFGGSNRGHRRMPRKDAESDVRWPVRGIVSMSPGPSASRTPSSRNDRYAAHAIASVAISPMNAPAF